MWAVFMIASLFLVVVLLNLLITIMGCTFSDVSAQILNLRIREKILLITQNETLFNREKVFGNSQYLIIINEGKSQASSDETIDSKVTGLRQDLADRVTALES